MRWQLAAPRILHSLIIIRYPSVVYSLDVLISYSVDLSDTNTTFAVYGSQRFATQDGLVPFSPGTRYVVMDRLSPPSSGLVL